MKPQTNNQGPKGMIKLIAVLFGLQLSVLTVANPIIGQPETRMLTCVTCEKDFLASLEAGSSIDLLALSPATPAEATFAEEETFSVIDLAPFTPKEASFEDELQSLEPSVLASLAPLTPREADFNELDLVN